MNVPVKKLAVLGGRGMLGTEVSAAARRRGFEVYSPDLPEFDITDAGQVKSIIEKVYAAVNCAAYTNVDGAETEKELAFEVNANAVGRLGEIAEKNNVSLIHISTDFVFDGQKNSPYVETDNPNPLSAYGRSKLEGERLLASAGCKHCIIRVEWTYGTAGNNFVKKIIAAAAARNSLKIVDDQVGSPTATSEAAEAVVALLCTRKFPEGLYHYAAEGYVSRYALARFVFEHKGIKAELLPCKSSDFTTPAKRPLNSRFDCSKIAAVLPQPIKRWDVVLADFLEKL